MNPDRFWELMALFGGPDEEVAVEVLREPLSRLAPEDILAFEQHFDHFVNQAYRWNLWGAAYTINGGCSDDGFHYFRCWLLTAGRQTYERALANPDSLADVVVNDGGFYETSGVNTVARQAWQAATGRDENEYFAELERLGSLGPAPDEGEDWDFDDDDEVWRRLPRLARMFLPGPGPDGKTG